MNETELHEKITEISKTVFNFCRAKTSTREDAEDLSQDILCELIRSGRNLRDDNAFYGFMWGVAGNVYKQWYRKKLKNQTCELTEDIPAEETPEEENEDIYLLRRELALLSEKYRKATVLYYIHGRSCAEIAIELSVSESTVKYLLFQSRKILKEGMRMERTLGEHSYNPKTLIPLYSGQGPNHFWEFMQSKIKQNIVSACYNNPLTAQGISLETGIPLPYLDDEIRSLADKKLLVKEGNYYKSNVIVITTECEEEMERAAVKNHKGIADQMELFLNSKLEAFKNIGFIGCDFSEDTLRWQLAVVLFRMILAVNQENMPAIPTTGWGESAYLWCVEKLNENNVFACCEVSGKHGDTLCFFDYLKDGKGKGDHRDFYGNERYINLFCDICRGGQSHYSEYDLEAIAEMIKTGYVLKEGEQFKAAIPVYTKEQYLAVTELAKTFISDELAARIREADQTAESILREHTPKHLQDQVPGIAFMDKFINAICAPASLLIDRKVLCTAWNPCEMPTTFAVLGEDNG